MCSIYKLLTYLSSQNFASASPMMLGTCVKMMANEDNRAHNDNITKSDAIVYAILKELNRESYQWSLEYVITGLCW